MASCVQLDSKRMNTLRSNGMRRPQQAVQWLLQAGDGVQPAPFILQGVNLVSDRNWPDWWLEGKHLLHIPCSLHTCLNSLGRPAREALHTFSHLPS